MTLEKLTLSDEEVQDIVASLITGGGGSDVVYDDTNDTLTVSLSDSISVNTLEATDASIDTLDAVDATVANRDIPNTLYRHELGLGEARFNLGLEQLQFKSGFFDTLQDESNVASKTDVEGFNGSVTTVSAVDVGSFRSAYDTLGFTPTSAVIGHTADQLADVTATDGDSFNYSASDVSEPTLTVTGETNTNNASNTFNEQADGDTQSVNIGGDVATDVDVTLTGTSKAGRHIDTYNTTTEATSSFTASPQNSLIIGSKRFDNIAWGYNYETGSEEFTVSTSEGLLAVAVAEDAGYFYCGFGTGGSSGGYKIFDIQDQSNVDSSFSGTWSEFSIDESNNLFWASGFDRIRAGNLSGGSGSTYSESDLFGVAADTNRGNAIHTTFFSNTITVRDSNLNEQFSFNPNTKAGEITGSYDQYFNYHKGTDSYILLHAYDDGSEYGIDAIASFDASDGSKNWDVRGDLNGYSIFVSESFATINDYIVIQSQDISADVDGVLYIDAQDGSYVNFVKPSPNGGRARLIEASPEYSNLWIADSDDESKFYQQSTNSSTEGVTYSLDGSTASVNSIGGGESVTETVTNIAPDSHTSDVSIDTGLVDIDLSYTEKTKTVDPSITIDSDAGSQTINYAGNLPDGDTVDLSNEIDPSLINGNVTVSVGVSETVDSPAGTVGLEYAHSDFDAGGLVKYRIEDDSGNSVVVTEDELVDLAFNSDNVRVEPVLQDGLGSVELFDYAVYFNGGTQ